MLLLRPDIFIRLAEYTAATEWIQGWLVGPPQRMTQSYRSPFLGHSVAGIALAEIVENTPAGGLRAGFAAANAAAAAAAAIPAASATAASATAEAGPAANAAGTSLGNATRPLRTTASHVDATVAGC